MLIDSEFDSRYHNETWPVSAAPTCGVVRSVLATSVVPLNRTAVGSGFSGPGCGFLLLVAATGCGTMLPPAHSSGAAFSEEGVVLAVVGQSCQQSPDANQTSKTRLDATFAIEVGNPSRVPLTVHPDRFALVVPDGTEVRTSTPEAAQSVAVESGTTSRLLLRFVANGNCSQELRLVPTAAIEMRGRPINIDPVRFVPVAPR